MEVVFRDICGNSSKIQVPKDSNAKEAIKCLSEKIGFNSNHIFLISPKDNMNFYQDYEKMDDIIKENPDYIVYIKNSNPKQNYFNEKIKSNEELDKSNDLQNKKLIVPPNSLCETLQSIHNWKFKGIYDEYSLAVDDAPPDYQERINQIAELGYPIEDIKEALRTLNYNTTLAITYLISHNLNDIFEDDDDDDSENSDYDNDSEVEFNDDYFNRYEENFIKNYQNADNSSNEDDISSEHFDIPNNQENNSDRKMDIQKSEELNKQIQQ